MPWYGWVLIGIAVVGIGYLKLKFLKKITSPKKEKEHHDED
jgi:hypothetical protein